MLHLALDAAPRERLGAAGYLVAQAHLDRDAVLQQFEADNNGDVGCKLGRVKADVPAPPAGDLRVTACQHRIRSRLAQVNLKPTEASKAGKALHNQALPPPLFEMPTFHHG